MINRYAFAYGVSNSNILFDNDGVGQFVDGFIDGAKEFKNNGTPIDGENYNHIKSQCFFKSGDAIKRGEYYIPPSVANKRYDDKHTLKERLIYERKAIKRDKPNEDGKLCVIKKSEMKTYLNGESPDVMDAFMMREWFDFDENKNDTIKSWSNREDVEGFLKLV